jgi:uncharacterized protein (TIGR02453 family)
MTATRPRPRAFTPELFRFLRDLDANNDRDWFHASKERYESVARHPALAFISDFGPELEKISRHFSADPRPVGGSLFRIHRDVRFSPDKRPYKTHIGIQFRHKLARDVHAPGFYLHLEPGSSFAGAGIWRPDSATLKSVRDVLAAEPDRWRRVKAGKRFSSVFELSGDSLKRAPCGYDPEHPLIEDLKRKDFVAMTGLTQTRITARGFLDDFARLCRAASPFMKFLCDAVQVPF